MSVCRHVYSSAYEDYRFTSITANEVEQLTMELSVLFKLSPIENNGEQDLIDCLVPKKAGWSDNYWSEEVEVFIFHTQIYQLKV